ncbi:MAG: bifunctional proline dehydrogenase/L-glutamate gamma-semialdehyde dehydrogenase [Rhodospirillales bacterium RIFCSPLOWO2_12_FULL_58_28]|nr:MAG: bifunctional proline dehydrogenase/L-glutamate gamma-semialdehyde dehydrogenase [Rhodospirillales bacterium RIFCSPLOWO2_02_FULL_58_16]OHC78277.1 MAG: bifunctional proline dehydrogenase/L-glutamate gamma-semialdehyde dehydrogenase [Rhodospirillales bacterium RIFCSPLOWO2_12_FULL_58_28]
MVFIGEFPQADALRQAIQNAAGADEASCVAALIAEAAVDDELNGRIAATARRLVETIRDKGVGVGGLDAFMHEYELSNREGVALMCLAEALLRVPDAKTADRLIRDKIGEADWEKHLGRSDSLFVNASTWALMLTGRVVRMDDDVGGDNDIGSYLRRMTARSGEPLIRRALVQAMRILGGQFVLGRTIGEALERARQGEAVGYCYSFDMLGESAHTAPDADAYFRAYCQAIAAIGAVNAGSGVSVKLSALHPRYEFSQRRRLMDELVPRMIDLAVRAADAGIGLCLDAEEADLLEPLLDVFAAAFSDRKLSGWDGLGLAVQAYQKRAPFVIDWLGALAEEHNRRITVRLVKGAYWDAEIKRAQEQGLAAYPVFTRKVSTDVSYLACARRLLARSDLFYPQFATHNAHTVAAVLEMAGKNRDFEFQRLHGMGESLYDQMVGDGESGVRCRVYAPVGTHEDLLAYLVRRLLENGANSSFVNRIVDGNIPIERIIADPAAEAAALAVKANSRIPLPADLYGAARRNAKGVDLSNPAELRVLKNEMEAAGGPWTADGGGNGKRRAILDPADNRRQVGVVIDAAHEDVDRTLELARKAAADWDATPAEQRAACLERAADLLEDNRGELMALCVREAGKTIPDALAEVREAVDFCRYYAERARIDFAGPQIMPGPTGETNQVSLHGRGVFVCLSPWNFPLAIFIGQVSAALAAGNAVAAKPAEQTPLIAARAVEILRRAGAPDDVVNLIPGAGPTVGLQLVKDARVGGVAFTGSVKTAHAINLTLAKRPGPIIPLIAETGGQNVMIVDSTALPEQVVKDVVVSAFRSAGQRCSALRVLFVQRDISPRLLKMLAGAVEELSVGDPALLSTDVGPVINGGAVKMLKAHARRMEREGKLLCRASLAKACSHGTFFAPCAYEIARPDMLKGEVFGPVLHIISYAADYLDQVIEAVNNTGFGLTLGVHSRVDSVAKYIQKRTRVGNTYVNRNMIGAVVGVQPFGGEGLSGTGPKAGGPRYLYRFAAERTLCVNTAASGGNAALLSLDEEDR